MHTIEEKNIQIIGVDAGYGNIKTAKTVFKISWSINYCNGFFLTGQEQIGNSSRCLRQNSPGLYIGGD